MPALGQRRVDVIVTSPPYNLGVEYGTYDDQLPREEYLRWTNRWAAADTLAEALVAEPSYEAARRALAEVLERMREAGRARALRPRP